MIGNMVNFLTYLATFLVLSVSVLYVYCKYKLTYWNKRGIKTPPIHLIFGNLKDTVTFKKPPGVVLQEIYESAETNEPYIGFYIFHKPALMIRDINLIKQIMVKDFDIFSDRMFGGKNQKDSVGLVNLLSINQPKWKYLRSKMTPTLTGQKLKKMVPLMFERGDPMLQFIDNTKSTDNDDWKQFELKTLSTRYATDVISSLAFGITTNSFDKDDVAFWEAGQKILAGPKRGIILMLLFFVPEVAPFIEPLTKAPAEFFRRVFWDSMNTREKVGNMRGDLIDSLLALKNGPQSNDFEFVGDNLLAQAVAFYVAGFEASSTAIAFALYELASHPEYEEKLYEEIKNVLEKGELSMDTINEMTFLDAVIVETLRLYPPLPLLDRIALRDYKIPETNLTIEKGTPVYISINGTNRDGRYFSEPTVFNPLRPKNEQYDFTGSFAFGIGPRSCVGQRLGMLITKVAVITLVLHYQITFKSDKTNLFYPTTVFTNAADGLYVHLRKRTNKETEK